MLEFVMDNVDGILAVVAALHLLAVAIVNLTPTPKDDEIVGKIYKVVEVLAGLVSNKAKDKNGEPVK